MQVVERVREEKFFLYIGATCAIAGVALMVLAGVAYIKLPAQSTVGPILHFLTSHPAWYWPLVQLGFSIGTLLWLASLSALTYSLRSLSGWIVGRIGTASIVLGATIHLIQAGISGYGLAFLANNWSAASPAVQSNLAQTMAQMLLTLQGIRLYTISFFYGLPFILYGLAVALSRNYPAWVGGLGLIGGSGAFISGLILFFQPFTRQLPRQELVYVIIASVTLISAWMLIMGVLMVYKAARQKA
jgi:hypothetical protein